MPLFSNRTIAQLLGDLPEDARSSFVPDLMGRIERGGATAVAAEWELLILHRLAVTGQLEVVPNAPGKSRPDAIFASKETGERVVIEVTAVSDEELDERFPINEFSHMFYRSLRKLRDEHIGSFDVVTEGDIEETGLPAVALPPRKDLDQFFRTDSVRRYIREIARRPLETHEFVYELKRARTTVTFRPGAQFSHSSGVAHQARMFNKFNEGRILRRIGKKARQINSSGLGLPAILVLCDNDCHVLRHHRRASWERESTVDSILTHIQGKPTLRLNGGPFIQRGAPQQTTAINAATVLWVDETRNWSSSISRRLSGVLVPNVRKAKFALSDEAIQGFVRTLDTHPPFLDSPINAKRVPRWPHHFGGYEMSDKKIRMSLLGLQDLLTGRISYDDFSAQNKRPIEHLQRLAAHGQCIKRAEIVPSPDVDDDWIELDVSAVDPRLFRRIAEEGLGSGGSVANEMNLSDAQSPRSDLGDVAPA